MQVQLEARGSVVGALVDDAVEQGAVHELVGQLLARLGAVRAPADAAARRLDLQAPGEGAGHLGELHRRRAGTRHEVAEPVVEADRRRVQLRDERVAGGQIHRIQPRAPAVADPIRIDRRAVLHQAHVRQRTVGAPVEQVVKEERRYRRAHERAIRGLHVLEGRVPVCGDLHQPGAAGRVQVAGLVDQAGTFGEQDHVHEMKSTPVAWRGCGTPVSHPRTHVTRAARTSVTR